MRLFKLRHKNRCTPWRRIYALCALFGMAGLLAGFCALPLSVPWVLHHQETLKQARARWMGAHFVSDRDVVLQSRANDCGAASLKMVLAAHGVECSVADLIHRLRLTPMGTSMLDLRQAAGEFGVPAKSWAIRPGELSRVPLPAIAFVNRNHFVVLRRWVAPEVLEVDDPAMGRLRWPIRAFKRLWSGETLVFDPTWTPL